MRTSNYTTIELHNAGRSNYTFGVWQEDGRNYPIFGLGSHDGYMTHMVYGADYANPTDVVATAKDKGGFWFDVGRDLYCTAEELERCMVHVGLIEAQS